MASEFETPEKDVAAEKVVSVELLAPEGWKKKFTPRKGGTPKRNVIVFISPTGEEIANKRQLDQYLHAHPGGPPSSEFDWGSGDTPRRSARLSAKAKPTETPEGEKPKKKERKSSSRKGAKDKKDEENEAPEAVEGAAADAADAAKEPADAEMKDAECDKDRSKEDARKGSAQTESMKTTNENVEEKTEGHRENKSMEKADQTEPIACAVEEQKEAQKAGKEKPDSEMQPPTSEGKEEENAEEKKIEDSDFLPPNSKGKENESSEKEKPENSAVLAQTSVPPKEKAPEVKKIKDGGAHAENDSFKDSRHSVNFDDGQHQPKASPVNA